MALEALSVSITAEENELIRETAAGRNGTNRKASNGDAACDADASLRTDEIGAAGEYAVAKALNASWGGRLFTRFEEWLDKRNTIADVGNFEVKSSVHSRPRLFIPKYQEERTKRDLPYILVKLRGVQRRDGSIKTFSGADLLGWAYGSEVIDKGVLEEYRAGRECYYLARKHLRPIAELVVQLENVRF